MLCLLWSFNSTIVLGCDVRADIGGEVANQAVYFPGVLPKLPGRFYFLFGKPIETEGIAIDWKTFFKLLSFELIEFRNSCSIIIHHLLLQEMSWN